MEVGDVPPGGDVTISFRVTVADPGDAVWLVINRALIRSEGMEQTRQALTVVGESHKVYLPLLMR